MFRRLNRKRPWCEGVGLCGRRSCTLNGALWWGQGWRIVAVVDPFGSLRSEGLCIGQSRAEGVGEDTQLK